MARKLLSGSEVQSAQFNDVRDKRNLLQDAARVAECEFWNSAIPSTGSNPINIPLLYTTGTNGQNLARAGSRIAGIFDPTSPSGSASTHWMDYFSPTLPADGFVRQTSTVNLRATVPVLWFKIVPPAVTGSGIRTY